VGQVWDKEIESQLNACDRVIISLSPNSVKSQTVRDGISYVVNLGKRNIPGDVPHMRCAVAARRHRYLDVPDRTGSPVCFGSPAYLKNENKLSTSSIGKSA
jgi:hypothetical protein